MLSGVAHVQIKVVKKVHGGKIFDTITKFFRIYFGWKLGKKLTLFTGTTKARAFKRRCS